MRPARVVVLIGADAAAGWGSLPPFGQRSAVLIAAPLVARITVLVGARCGGDVFGVWCVPNA